MEDVEQAVFVSADPGAHAEHLNALAELGFDEIYLHHVGQTQDRFLEVFGDQVLPQLDVTRKEVRGAACGSPRPATSGGRPRSSTAWTSRPSWTGTTTARATSPAWPSGWTTCTRSASPACG